VKENRNIEVFHFWRGSQDFIYLEDNYDEMVSRLEKMSRRDVVPIKVCVSRSGLQNWLCSQSFLNNLPRWWTWPAKR